MVSLNVGSVADYAYFRINNVPSDISGTVMVGYATQNVFQLSNWVRSSIDPASFSDEYAPFLIEMTVAMTLGRMHGVGVHYNWNLGEFGVSKGSASSTEALQVQIALDNAKLALTALSRPNAVYMTYYG